MRVWWNPDCVSSDKTNDKSVVVECGYRGKGLWLMGDATGKVTSIITPDKIPNMLLIAHHGADDDGCNANEWLSRLGTVGYVISSSGIHHNHPKGTVIDTCKTILNPAVPIVATAAAGAGSATNISNHRITYHTIEKESKKCEGAPKCEECKLGKLCKNLPRSVESDGSIAITKMATKEIMVQKSIAYPVYHTSDLGDITVCLNDKGWLVSYPRGHSTAGASPPDPDFILC